MIHKEPHIRVPAIDAHSANPYFCTRQSDHHKNNNILKS